MSSKTYTKYELRFVTILGKKPKTLFHSDLNQLLLVISTYMREIVRYHNSSEYANSIRLYKEDYEDEKCELLIRKELTDHTKLLDEYKELLK